VEQDCAEDVVVFDLSLKNERDWHKVLDFTFPFILKFMDAA